MKKSKKRDLLYGPKPRNVEQKAEELPQTPARKPYHGFCKKLKSDHVFAFFDLKAYPHRRRLGTNWSGPIYITGMTHYKEYRCVACQKKKIVRDEWEYDKPVREQI